MEEKHIGEAERGVKEVEIGKTKQDGGNSGVKARTWRLRVAAL